MRLRFYAAVIAAAHMAEYVTNAVRLETSDSRVLEYGRIMALA